MHLPQPTALHQRPSRLQGLRGTREQGSRTGCGHRRQPGQDAPAPVCAHQSAPGHRGLRDRGRADGPMQGDGLPARGQLPDGRARRHRRGEHGPPAAPAVVARKAPRDHGSHDGGGGGAKRQGGLPRVRAQGRGEGDLHAHSR